MTRKRDIAQTAADAGVVVTLTIYVLNLFVQSGLLSKIGLQDGFLTSVEQFVLLLVMAFLFSTTILLRNSDARATA